MANIVQEWAPRPAGDGPDAYQGTSSSAATMNLAHTIRREAQENGIERPYGYNVSFHYNPEVEGHHFGRSHPMKPWRLQLTKQLVLSYGLQHVMDLYLTREATRAELAEFHKEDFLEYLAQITPENSLLPPISNDFRRFGFGDDCPVFDGLYRYCALYTGASLSACRTLISSSHGSPEHSNDIAINWSGGLHHAFKSWASGFCYVNDAVLCIQQLLAYHPRVMYIDIDVHHGDGVEAAFNSTDRVLTLSFHKYDPAEFFPGTGALTDTGPEDTRNPGAHHTLNVPLRDGIDDDQYARLFRSIAGSANTHFRPTAVVLQCGADSLGGDRLGRLNLNISAHGACVSFVKSWGVPLLLLGGGGYTARNVARLWCHETALALGVAENLPETIPEHVPYRQAFTGADNGDGLLRPNLSHVAGRRHENHHDEPYLAKLERHAHEQLRYLNGAPSVQMQQVPKDVWALREELEEQMRDEREEDDYRRREQEQNVGGRIEMVE